MYTTENRHLHLLSLFFLLSHAKRFSPYLKPQTNTTARPIFSGYFRPNLDFNFLAKCIWLFHRRVSNSQSFQTTAHSLSPAAPPHVHRWWSWSCLTSTERRTDRQTWTWKLKIQLNFLLLLLLSHQPAGRPPDGLLFNFVFATRHPTRKVLNG